MESIGACKGKPKRTNSAIMDNPINMYAARCK